MTDLESTLTVRENTGHKGACASNIAAPRDEAKILLDTRDKKGHFETISICK